MTNNIIDKWDDEDWKIIKKYANTPYIKPQHTNPENTIINKNQFDLGPILSGILCFFAGVIVLWTNLWWVGVCIIVLSIIVISAFSYIAVIDKRKVKTDC